MLTFKQMLRAVKFEAGFANYSAPPKPTRDVTYWRDDAFENAAQIVERYGADPQIATDIRALKKGSAK